MIRSGLIVLTKGTITVELNTLTKPCTSLPVHCARLRGQPRFMAGWFQPAVLDQMVFTNPPSTI